MAYTFDGDINGWSGDGFTWNSLDGFPAAGCATKVGTFGTALMSITGLSIAVGTADTLQFYAKYTGSLAVGSGLISLEAKNSGGSVLNSICRIVGGFDAGADVWQEGISTAGFIPGTVTTLELSVTGSNSLTLVSFDSVYVVEVPTPPPSYDELRVLGLDTDSAYLYQTYIGGGTLTFDYYEFGGTAPFSSVALGTVNYASPDALTGGMYPVVKYGNDHVIYLRGRNAAGQQLLRNDLGGTSGFLELGPGTAVWATSTFLASFMMSYFTPSNWVGGLSNGAFYLNANGDAGEQWEAGDDIANIFTASRNPIDENNILAGGGGGSVFYSGNGGQTFTSGGTVVGTVNWIEFSQ